MRPLPSTGRKNPQQLAPFPSIGRKNPQQLAPFPSIGRKIGEYQRETLAQVKNLVVFFDLTQHPTPPSHTHTHTHVRMILQNIRYYVRKVYCKHIVVDHWKQKIYSFFIYKKNPPSYPHIHAENIFCTARCVTDAQMNFVFICSL